MMSMAAVCGHRESQTFVVAHLARLPIRWDPPGPSVDANDFALKIMHDAQSKAASPEFRADRDTGAVITSEELLGGSALINAAMAGQHSV